MIRAAGEALQRRRLLSVATTTLLALALILPAAAALVGLGAVDGASRWLADYHPVVYVHLDADSAEIEALAGELRAWPEVAAVTHREPRAAHEQLVARLGASEVDELGLQPALLPHSLVLAAATPLVDHLALLTRVAALEARPEVARVHLPGPQARRMLAFATGLLLTALVLLALLLACALAFLLFALRRFEEDELAELALLERFGAPAHELARPNLTRGLLIGVRAGLVAALVLLACTLLTLHLGPRWLGSQEIPAASWIVVALPALIAPLVGLLAGKLTTARRRRPRRHEVDEELGLEALLVYSPTQALS